MIIINNIFMDNEMTSYAKKTCYECGIRLPQPQMQKVKIGKVRRKWLCDDCYDQQYPQLTEAQEQRLVIFSLIVLLFLVFGLPYLIFGVKPGEVLDFFAKIYAFFIN